MVGTPLKVDKDENLAVMFISAPFLSGYKDFLQP
jgi:hypothetical protein